MPYGDEKGVPHWDQAIGAAMVLAAQGNLAGARARLAEFPAEVKTALQLEPANASLWRGLALMEALLGQKEEALRDARKAVQLMPATFDTGDDPDGSVGLAIVYAWTGDKDAAMAELRRLVGMPYRVGEGGTMNVNVHCMRTDPWWAPLRGDPRFEALLNDPKNNAPLF